jgi:glycosyltransferase involved in cell wall biosynthesis
LRIIPNSINLNVCAPPDAGARVRKELRVNESAPLVAVVGQLVPWKRHDVFLKALASVVKQVPETVGLIVGDDLFEDNSGYKLEISDLARQLALERNAKFLGWRDDVYAVLAACDLLVIPSQAEPFGRVALEAMAMGKPVVGTRAGGLPDVVADGETGWLFPPGDHVALAAAILRALSEPATAKRMGEAGRERVRKLFDSKLTTRSVEDLYEVLLSRRRGEL